MSSADVDLENKLAAARIVSFPRPPLTCEQCWDEADPAWQCQRCTEVFCAACAKAHVEPPGCDGREDE